MVPVWLSLLSWISIMTGVVCFLIILADVMRNPPGMVIMRAVWPICGLFGGPLVLWFYRRHGHGHADPDTAFPVVVAKGTLHCGAGCTLGDMIADPLLLLFPAILVPLGYPGLFSEPIFAVWVLNYILAFGIGIAFQYFAIVPMRKLGVVDGLLAAFKADAASLSAWQVGMYGVMAIAHFWLFPVVLGAKVDATMPLFWLVMQIAMLAGFATAYPVNWWLIRAGIKEAM